MSQVRDPALAQGPQLHLEWDEQPAVDRLPVMNPRLDTLGDCTDTKVLDEFGALVRSGV